MKEATVQDSKYYIIPALAVAIPVHGGNYTANKLLAGAGMVSTLVQDLPTVTGKQLAAMFPNFSIATVQREIVVVKKRSNFKHDTTKVRMMKRITELERLVRELQIEMG